MPQLAWAFRVPALKPHLSPRPARTVVHLSWRKHNSTERYHFTIDCKFRCTFSLTWQSYQTCAVHLASIYSLSCALNPLILLPTTQSSSRRKKETTGGGLCQLISVWTIFVCMYICMGACVYTHTGTHTHNHRHTHRGACTYTHRHTHTCTHTHAHKHRHTHIHIHTGAHTQAHVHAKAHIHSCTRTHTHIYTHTRMRTHTGTHTRSALVLTQELSVPWSEASSLPVCWVRHDPLASPSPFFPS